MTIQRIVFLLLFVGSLSLSASGQQPGQGGSLPDKIDKHFQFLTGTWEYSYQENGKTYNGVWSVRRSENGAALLSHFREVGPKGKVSGNYLHGWNAGSNQLIDNFVSDKNGIGQATYTLISKDKAEGSSESTLPDGTRRTTKLRSEYSPDKIVWTNYQTVLDGQKQPDRVFTFIRQKNTAKTNRPETASATLPDDVKAKMAKQVGTWTTRGTRDGKTFEGLYQAQWNDAETGLIFNSREGHHVLHGMSHWDPQTGAIVEVWATPQGTAILHFEKLDDDRWSGHADLQFDADSPINGVGIELKFHDGGFAFFGDAAPGKLPFSVTNTHVSLDQSMRALQSFGDLFVGGTWVNKEDDSVAEHIYTWLPGEKVLNLRRTGGSYPGVSVYSVHHPTQSVRGYELDNDGVMGIATMVQTRDDQYKLYGHYTGKDDTQDLLLTITQTGPDSVEATGSIRINGKTLPWKARHWTRK
ncbi:hypothetical protein NZK35_18785 [Stieleria sp. ICT_E10.1]|uniref:hypothetical protein n=1 Tax=Stieleria sedimenti TaxID=2976331 RepID=UPI0021804A1C|nr:hypothetical protein [Stieleria sedimenti]MCS7468704.1 hypothetical protein [Stieleria sedimenti]